MKSAAIEVCLRLGFVLDWAEWRKPWGMDYSGRGDTNGDSMSSAVGVCVHPGMNLVMCCYQPKVQKCQGNLECLWIHMLLSGVPW